MIYPEINLNQINDSIIMPNCNMNTNFQFYLKNFKNPNEPQQKIKKTNDDKWAKGKWTAHEQKEYIIFISSHRDFMESKLNRKSKKIFLQMSNVIKSRSAQQCRSHHQKMLIYKNSLQEIIHSYSYLYENKKQKQLNTQIPISQIQSVCQNGLKVIGSKIYIVLNESDIASF